MDTHKVSLLKCTTTSETLVMHDTTFLCLSLVPPGLSLGLGIFASQNLHFGGWKKFSKTGGEQKVSYL